MQGKEEAIVMQKEKQESKMTFQKWKHKQERKR